MAYDEQAYVDGWATYSNWIDDIRDDDGFLAQQYDEDEKFRDKFLSNKNHFQRFKILWDDERIRKEIKRIYASQIKLFEQKYPNAKSTKESNKHRNLGNQSFKEGNYLEAIKQYSQAIRFAPYPDTVGQNGSVSDDTETRNTTTKANSSLETSDCLSLALANRSAALFSLTRYKLCLHDIELALKFGYPEVNRFKLYIRRIKCLHVLSVWANDMEQMKLYLQDLLRKNDIKEFIKVEINTMFEFLEQTTPHEVDRDDLDIVDENNFKICNINRTLGMASDCVEMSYDKDKGRYLLTNKDVSYGRVLVAEDPFVANLASMKRDSYCYQCLGRLHSCGIGCYKCTQVLYCSLECLEISHPVHSYECQKLLSLQHELGVSYLVAHIMFKIDFNLEEFPINVKKSAQMKSLDELLRIPLCDWPDLDYKSNYASLLSLTDHSDKFDYDAIMGYGLTAVYLVTAFIDKLGDRVPKLRELNSQLLIGSIVLKHLTQLQSNLISILYQDLKGLTSIGHSLTGIEERPIGVGLYPTVSLLNHSCNPNVISIFNRNRFVIRAGKSLECGTELNYCYGPHVSRMSKIDRQTRLQDQYFFTCTCECCSENIENKSRALLCPDCKGPVIYNYDMTNECMECHAKNNLEARTYLQLIDRYKSALDTIRSRKDLDLNTKKLKIMNIETQLQKYAFPHNPVFVNIKSYLIECSQALDDMDSALKFSEQELALSDAIYGEKSYESIMTKLKLINYKWRSIEKTIESTDSIECLKDQDNPISLDIKALDDLVTTTRSELRDLLASTNILGAESSYETEMMFLGDVRHSIQKYTTKSDR